MKELFNYLENTTNRCHYVLYLTVTDNHHGKLTMLVTMVMTMLVTMVMTMLVTMVMTMLVTMVMTMLVTMVMMMMMLVMMVMMMMVMMVMTMLVMIVIKCLINPDADDRDDDLSAHCNWLYQLLWFNQAKY